MAVDGVRYHHVGIADRCGRALLRAHARSDLGAWPELWHRLLDVGVETGLAIERAPFVPQQVVSVVDFLVAATVGMIGGTVQGNSAYAIAFLESIRALSTRGRRGHNEVLPATG